MAIWTCYECGGTVTGYEGERGKLRGVCPICGRGYGGAKSIERPLETHEEEAPEIKGYTRYALCVGTMDCYMELGQYNTPEEAEAGLSNPIIKKGQRWMIQTRPFGCYQAFVYKDNEPKLVKEGVKL